jgi:predicted type IV restriction endonuclease
MANVPTRISARLAEGLKRFQPILTSARTRDLGESDTVTIVVDLLADIFGFDKYSEITSEHAIRGTYCDLAVKVDNALLTMIEVKAIGLELSDAHVKQAIDYAANQGVDWVILTNAVTWRVYKVTFAKPIDKELVLEIDMLSTSHRNEKDLECLYLISREGWTKSALGEFHVQKQALSRFFLGAMILSEPVLQVIRRELRRVSPDVRIDVDEIRTVLTTEVLKRDVLEGDKADDARRKLTRAANRALRERTNKTGGEASIAEAPVAVAAIPSE